MPNSMTGYGYAMVKGKRASYVAEAKSVNNRYCEVNTLLPRDFVKVEHLVEKSVRKAFARGKFDIVLRVEAPDGPEALRFPKERIARRWRELEVIRKQLKLPEPVSLETLIQLNRNWFFGEKGRNPEDERKLIEAVELCLEKLRVFRVKEGKALMKVIVGQLSKLQKLVGQIRSHVERKSEARMKELLARVQKILQPDDPNIKKRVEVELAMLIEKADITEELDRLDSHLRQMHSLCKSNTPVGREMDFVIQEINREINTIGSKTYLIKVKEWVVIAKSEIEKMREQAQNVE